MVKEKSISRKHKKQKSYRGSSSQPAQPSVTRAQVFARLEEANYKVAQFTRELMEGKKDSPTIIVEPSTGENPGRRKESDVHDSTTAQPWFEKLAPPPLPKGHAHFRSTGLMYHEPQGKKGLTVSGIKKMLATSSETREKRKKGGPPSTQ